MLKALSGIGDLRESKVGIFGRKKYPPLVNTDDLEDYK